MRAARRFSAALIVALCVGTEASAQFCPPLTTSPTPVPADESPAGFFVRGMGYLDSNCLAEARTLLETAARLEGTAPTVRVAQALKLLAAKEALAGGRPVDAQRELRALIRDFPNAIVMNAVEMLAVQLRDPDDPDWILLESSLTELADRGFTYSDMLLRDHQAATLGAAGAARKVEAVLDHESRPQRVLMLRILLAGLYLRDGRILNASVLMGSLEPEVGRNLLDIRGRQRFLETGVQVWKRRMEDGRPEYTDRLRAYETALDELRKVVGQ
jgi:hypothetical protein